MMADRRVPAARRGQLAGFDHPLRTSRAIYVVQTARRVNPGPIGAGYPGNVGSVPYLAASSAGSGPPIVQRR
jgi:hypothetical protein